MRSANATCAAAATAFREYEDAFLVFHGREEKGEAIRGYIHGGRKRKAQHGARRGERANSSWQEKNYTAACETRHSHM